MTAEAESLPAGILAHLPGLTAVTAPSSAGYLRRTRASSARPRWMPCGGPVWWP
ncbi:hypothetical protein ACFU3E_27460 [Streptomyces sp. NPDC057424]|uniref:hypothetical protein n=1 Tax=Streptomyces sp. NPDC057424 TaxID=3346127 RepID=UPI0036C256E6